MFEVKNGKITKYFADKKDADNYIDYIENGLKVVGKSIGCYKFNDGSLMSDVIMKDATEKKYVLHKHGVNGDRITSERLQKKYIKALEKYLKT